MGYSISKRKQKLGYLVALAALMSGCVGVSQSVGPDGVHQKAGPYEQSVGPDGVHQTSGSWSQDVDSDGVSQGNQ